MDVRFVLISSVEMIESDVAEWAQTADKNRFYSMSEIVFSIYGFKYPSEEFARVAPTAADALREAGFARVYLKNRRFWVMDKASEKP